MVPLNVLSQYFNVWLAFWNYDPLETIISYMNQSSSSAFWLLFFLRMTNACHRKCVPPHYKEAELTKGEAVCLDRCVAKYLDLHEKLGRKLTELSVQDEEMMRKAAMGSG